MKLYLTDRRSGNLTSKVLTWFFASQIQYRSTPPPPHMCMHAAPTPLPHMWTSAHTHTYPHTHTHTHTYTHTHTSHPHVYTTHIHTQTHTTSKHTLTLQQETGSTKDLTWLPSIQARSERMMAARDWMSSTGDPSSWMRMTPAWAAVSAMRMSSFSEMLQRTDAATDWISSLSSFSRSTRAGMAPDNSNWNSHSLHAKENNNHLINKEEFLCVGLCVGLCQHNGVSLHPLNILRWTWCQDSMGHEGMWGHRMGNTSFTNSIRPQYG